MRRKTMKMLLTAMLSAGILFSLTAGVSYASEVVKSYGDHQELQIPIYAEDVDAYSDGIEAADQAALKNALKDSDVTDVTIDGQEITNAITIKRPVHFKVVGYDELSDEQQKNLKIKIDLPEKEGGVMTVCGLPREKVELVRQGSTVIYWDEAPASATVSETAVEDEEQTVSEAVPE